MPEPTGDFRIGRLFNEDCGDPRRRHTLAPILQPSLLIGQRCVGAGQLAGLRRPRSGFPAQFLYSLINCVEIVGGTGLGHVSSLMTHDPARAAGCFRAFD